MLLPPCSHGLSYLVAEFNEALGEAVHMVLNAAAVWIEEVRNHSKQSSRVCRHACYAIRSRFSMQSAHGYGLAILWVNTNFISAHHPRLYKETHPSRFSRYGPAVSAKSYRKRDVYIYISPEPGLLSLAGEL